LWLTSIILTTWEAEIGRIGVQLFASPGKHETPAKITTAKCTGGVAKVVECLLCKQKALSSRSKRNERHSEKK
jgi:hypothetical protein